ncbi:MAG TPA: response regulator transcription factor [Bryobacteraceae bacterium]|nr:response regulator transcription factor [Bryobacteraceae bacterium]
MPAVLIVDDNLLVREGLKHLLNQAHRGLVFGEASNGEEVQFRLGKRSWDVAVIDVSNPAHDGFQTLQEIRRMSPATRILILGPHPESEHGARARQLKVSGCWARSASRSELLKAFQNVLAGREYFGDGTQDGSGAPARHPALSTRERDVLARCVAGRRMGEIALELNLSIKTVSTYKRRILDKLQLHSISELVRHAIEHKLC